MGLIRLAALSAVGYAIYKHFNKAEGTEAFAGNAGGNFGHVRDSGPEHMTTPPKKWSKTDEAIDESFPASDPPSTY